MYRLRRALFGAAALAAACSSGPADDSAVSVGTAVLFEGARLIPGDGAAPIEQAAFVVDGGMITQLGSGQLDVPADVTRVDLTRVDRLELALDDVARDGGAGQQPLAGTWLNFDEGA